ncbi:hypothetical protein VOM14_05810 [Paraburkholderia sp. MPAMCS5]|uniref:helix-turn-helix transcriptional regulator n=1 Tax=Paraburkholderia sp. MPAMCS5 TaxID=3112563 RepID=UPI002E197C23|nr:hypothetical protein [Paraburkholderia sp. MPAMCS5]
MPAKNIAAKAAHTPKAASALAHHIDAPLRRAGTGTPETSEQEQRLGKLRGKHSKRPKALEAQATPATLPLDGISRWEQIRLYIGFSGEWVRQMELAGKFPRRTKIGASSCWKNREIHAWMSDPAGWTPAETVEG